LNPHSIQIVPKRDDARAVVPGSLVHLSIDGDETRIVIDHLPAGGLAAP
jgi:hypothetical protein